MPYYYPVRMPRLGFLPLTTSMRRVPQFDFTTTKFAAGLPLLQNMKSKPTWEFIGPSQPIQNIALAVLGLGQILPITPLGIVRTYLLQLALRLIKGRRGNNIAPALDGVVGCS